MVDVQLDDPPRRKPRRAGRRWLPWSTIVLVLGIVLAAGSIALVMNSYGMYQVPSPAMSPTLQTGDRVLIRKGAADQAQRGDIVVFRSADWQGTPPGAPFVKRIVGIGGDVVECCDDAGELTVNGVAIDEPYARGDQGSMPFATRVPDGSVFLLGDWRDHSKDSRHYVRPDGSGGSVPVTGIEGIVVCVGSKLLPPVTEFTDAGLPATRDGDLLTWPPIVGLLVSPVLVVLGLVGPVIGMVRRLRH